MVIHMEQEIFYSILVVCLNPGKRIEDTLESVFRQTYTNYEVIIKDGGSTDGSKERVQQLIEKAGMQEKARWIETKDTGIYDAMNQAISYATGDYLLFLNAGDDFYTDTVLSEVTKTAHQDSDLIYGNLYHKALDTVIYASPQIDAFTCYRNVPCHQTCFYKRSLFAQRGYEPKYNVRADYEHFLWCYFEAKAKMEYVPVIVAAYEGGGYSETKENRKRSAAQHREIVVKYMGKKQANHYRRIMWLTLAPLRSFLAESTVFSGIYNGIKNTVYRLIRKKEG